MKPGLVSITFRKLSASQIVGLCVQNQLSLIEWGGDIHVPHGDLAAAAAVRDLTCSAGLGVAGYGSYFRLGQSRDEGLSFESVLETAAVLGAPAIRVWPGTVDPADASPTYRQAICDEALEIADLAAEKGILVCYEFHAKTLTATLESAMELLEKTSHPAIRCLWQPYNGRSTEECLEALRTVMPYLHYAHVFHWFPDGKHKFPLADGRDRWSQYLEVLKPKACAALLEFVRNENPDQLPDDAATLRDLLKSP